MSEKGISTSLKAIIILVAIFLAEWFLFQNFVKREMAWSPFLNGDANWILSESYVVFDSILKNHTVPPSVYNAPAGVMLYLFTSILYLFFGASRLAALSTNFIFFILWQLAIFTVIRYVSRSWAVAFTVLGLCLTLNVPIQGDSINPILNIAEYQRDFITFCLFGIFISAILFSNSFHKRSWAVYAGLIAGLMVTFRYNALFYFIGIYLAILVFFLIVFLIKRYKVVDGVAAYKIRIVNAAISLFSMSMVFLYPVYRGKDALYRHYFVGKLVGPKDKTFIELYSHGVNDFFQQIMYYPLVIINTGLGQFFINTFSIVVLVLLFFIARSVFIRTKMGMRGSNLIMKEKFYKVGENSSGLNSFAFYVVLCICLVVPLSLLTTYPVRSGNVGLFLTSAFAIFVYVAFSDLYGRFNISGNKSLSIIGIIMALVALSFGMSYQIKAYERRGTSTNHRQDYLEVARLYDDMVNVSKKSGIKKPTVSINFLQNYVLGCGEAITAYQYEKAGELFRVTPLLGSDIGNGITKESAFELLRDSDLVILSMTKELPEKRGLVSCDPLAEGLYHYPFYKSVREYHEDIVSFVKERFSAKGKYKICCRDIVLYAAKDLPFRPVAVYASSQMNEEFSAEAVLQAPGIWHSTPNPEYPQWIEFKYKSPVIINNITVRCQPGAPMRAPLEFYLQGQGKDGQWKNLLAVENAGFTDKEELKSWHVENYQAFSRYRILITKNNGEPTLLTIGRIKFDYLMMFR